MTFADTKGESNALGTLLAPIDNNRFQSAVRRFHTLFNIYASTSPVPLPAPGLIITPEIRVQCERYLPIADVATVFNRLYFVALTYPPIISSTPFHNALSWADTFAALPPQFQFSANPARLLESLLTDSDSLTRFLFASFLPKRFYGGSGRYPGQQLFVRDWLISRRSRALRCLDAACGTGEETYGLAHLLSERGFPPAEVRIDGWTVEPLEVWAATHCRLPHDQHRESQLVQVTSKLSKQGFLTRIRFHCIDLTQISFSPEETACRGRYDLIRCNGLLGGPIINNKESLGKTAGNLAQLLAPGGILLAADNFHGGWKQKCPQGELRALFEMNGLRIFEAGEGIGGLKPY